MVIIRKFSGEIGSLSGKMRGVLYFKKCELGVVANTHAFNTCVMPHFLNWEAFLYKLGSFIK